MAKHKVPKMIKRLLFILLTFLFGIYSTLIIRWCRWQWGDIFRSFTDIKSCHYTETTFYVRISRCHLHQSSVRPTIALRIVNALQEAIVLWSNLAKLYIISKAKQTVPTIIRVSIRIITVHFQMHRIGLSIYRPVIEDINIIKVFVFVKAEIIIQL